jgi:hypothetical protein
MNNLETFGPKLTQVNKENPFRVPEGYFDSLPSRVQDLCKKQEAETHRIKWISTFKTQFALAAGICFFILLATAGFYYSKQAGDFTLFNNTDYIKLVESSGTEFDEIQLYEAVSSGVKKDTVKKQMNDELIEYLLYNNIENGTLLEQPKDIKP